MNTRASQRACIIILWALICCSWAAEEQHRTIHTLRLPQLPSLPGLPRLPELPNTDAITRYLTRAVGADEIVSCGGSSTDTTRVVWQNPLYPQWQKNLPAICIIKLTPRQDTCALRLAFDDLDLTSSVPIRHDCPHDSPSLKMSYSEGITPPLCSDVTGYEGILELKVRSEEPMTLLLQLDPTKEFRFRVNATAVPCTTIRLAKSPRVCGIKNNGTPAPLREATTPTPDANQETNQTTGRYQSSDRPITDAANEPLTQEEEEEEGEARGGRGRKRRNKSSLLRKRDVVKKLRKREDVLSESLALGLESGLYDVLLPERSRRLQQIKEPNVGEWPWMVAIERTILVNPGVSRLPVVARESAFPCTGVLLDNTHVLTAANCIFPDPSVGTVRRLGLRAVLGEYDYGREDEAEVLNLTVSRVTFPLTYDPHSTSDNLAVLTLADTVEFSDTIRPICLPVDYNRFPKENGIVSGWRTGDQGTKSFENDGGLSVLAQAELSVLPSSDCQNTLNAVPFPTQRVKDQFQAERLMCTRAVVGSSISSACQFGPGSSLTRRDRTGAHHLVGMLTGGGNCLQLNFPDLYTSIAPRSLFLALATT